MVVRRLFAVALATLFSLTALASEPGSDEHVSFVDATMPQGDVTITPIPMPAAVTELLPPINPAAKLRAAKRAKQAAKATLQATLLTRTERHQLALLVTRNKTDDSSSAHNAEQNDEGQPNDGELTLHQFYSRPRLVRENEKDDHNADAMPLSDTVRVRLLMARLKALEAHTLAQVVDDGEALPAHVTDRLKMARAKALEAHRSKFS